MASEIKCLWYAGNMSQSVQAVDERPCMTLECCMTLDRPGYEVESSPTNNDTVDGLETACEAPRSLVNESSAHITAENEADYEPRVVVISGSIIQSERVETSQGGSDLHQSFHDDKTVPGRPTDNSDLVLARSTEIPTGGASISEDCAMKTISENIDSSLPAASETLHPSNYATDGDIIQADIGRRAADERKVDDVIASCYTETDTSASAGCLVQTADEAGKACSQSGFESSTGHTEEVSKTSDVIDNVVTSPLMYSDVTVTCTADELYKSRDQVLCLVSGDNLVSVNESETNETLGLPAESPPELLRHCSSKETKTSGSSQLQQSEAFHDVDNDNHVTDDVTRSPVVAEPGNACVVRDIEDKAGLDTKQQTGETGIDVENRAGIDLELKTGKTGIDVENRIGETGTDVQNKTEIHLEYRAGTDMEHQTGIGVENKAGIEVVVDRSGMDVLASVCECLVNVEGSDLGSTASTDKLSIIDKAGEVIDGDGHHKNPAETIHEKFGDNYNCVPNAAISNDSSSTRQDQLTSDVISGECDVSKSHDTSCTLREEHGVDDSDPQMYRKSLADGKNCEELPVPGTSPACEGTDNEKIVSRDPADDYDNDDDEYSTGCDDVSSEMHEFSIELGTDTDEYSTSSSEYDSDEGDDTDDFSTDGGDDSDSESTQHADDVRVFDDAREFDPNSTRQDDQNCTVHKDTSEDSKTLQLVANNTLNDTYNISHIEEKSFAKVPDNDCSEVSTKVVRVEHDPQGSDQPCRKYIRLGIVEDCSSSEFWWRRGVLEDSASVENRYELHVPCDVDHYGNNNDDDDDDDGTGASQVAEADCGKSVNPSSDKTVHAKTNTSDVNMIREISTIPDYRLTSEVVASPPSYTGLTNPGLDNPEPLKDRCPLQQGGDLVSEAAANPPSYIRLTNPVITSRLDHPEPLKAWFPLLRGGHIMETFGIEDHHKTSTILDYHLTSEANPPSYTGLTNSGLDHPDPLKDRIPPQRDGHIMETFGIEGHHVNDPYRTSEDEVFYTDCDDQLEGKNTEHVGSRTILNVPSVEADWTTTSYSSCDVPAILEDEKQLLEGRHDGVGSTVVSPAIDHGLITDCPSTVPQTGYEPDTVLSHVTSRCLIKPTTSYIDHGLITACPSVVPHIGSEPDFLLVHSHTLIGSIRQHQLPSDVIDGECDVSKSQDTSCTPREEHGVDDSAPRMYGKFLADDKNCEELPGTSPGCGSNDDDIHVIDADTAANISEVHVAIPVPVTNEDVLLAQSRHISYTPGPGEMGTPGCSSGGYSVTGAGTFSRHERPCMTLGCCCMTLERPGCEVESSGTNSATVDGLEAACEAPGSVVKVPGQSLQPLPVRTISDGDASNSLPPWTDQTSRDLQTIRHQLSDSFHGTSALRSSQCLPCSPSKPNHDQEMCLEGSGTYNISVPRDRQVLDDSQTGHRGNRQPAAVSDVDGSVANGNAANLLDYCNAVSEDQRPDELTMTSQAMTSRAMTSSDDDQRVDEVVDNISPDDELLYATHHQSPPGTLLVH